MAIIVAGRLTIKPGWRDEFVARSIDAVVQARAHDACEDFSVSADPVDSTRVNIFEKWQSRAALDAFRNAGPESDLFDLVESFDTNEYDV
jgi:quinol monooxygenase YgiN